MATLILGGIGALIGSAGGPAGARLGWAIGATLGGVVDTLNQPGIHTETGKLSDLKYTGSSYGTIFPQIWGKTRVGGNVIWIAANDEGEHLFENRHTESSGGGGSGNQRSSATTITYSASFAVALGKGATKLTDAPESILNKDLIITRIWADDKIVWEDGADDNIIDIHWHDGAEDQEIDDYIEAWVNAHPEQYFDSGYSGSTDIPAYRGTAYVTIIDMDLGNFGNRIPNFSFEVEQETPPTIASIIRELERSVGVPNARLDFTDAIQPVEGYLLGDRVPAQDGINQLLAAYLTDLVEVDGVQRLVPRGSGNSFTIDEDDLGAFIATGGSNTSDIVNKVIETRTQDVELPGRVDVTYFSTESDKHYEQSTQTAIKQTAPVENSVSLALGVSMSDDDGRKLAGSQLDVAWDERRKFQFSLPPSYTVIAPADCGLLPINGNDVRIRILTIELGLPGELRFTAVPDNPASLEQFLVGARSRPNNTPFRVRVVPTDFIVWSGHELRNEDQLQPGFYLSATGASGWSGGSIFYSSDSGATWIPAGNVAAKAVIGESLTTLADGVLGGWDTTNTVDVSVLDGGKLGSTSEADVLNGNNIIRLGNEILGFTTAAILTSSSYRLSHLKRGIRGSTLTGHSSGEDFAIVNNTTTKRVSVPVSLVGETILVRVASRYQDITEATEHPVTITSRTLTQVEQDLIDRTGDPTTATIGDVQTILSDGTVGYAPGVSSIIDPTGMEYVTSTNVQGAIDELDQALENLDDTVAGLGSGSAIPIGIIGNTYSDADVDTFHFDSADFITTDEGASGTTANKRKVKIETKKAKVWFGYIDVSSRLATNILLAQSGYPNNAIGDIFFTGSDYTGTSRDPYPGYAGSPAPPAPTLTNMTGTPQPPGMTVTNPQISWLSSGGTDEFVTHVTTSGVTIKVHRPVGLSGAVGGKCLVEISPATSASYGTYIFNITIPRSASGGFFTCDKYELGFTVNDAQVTSWAVNPPNITTTNGQFNNGQFVGPINGITSFISQPQRQERRSTLTATGTIAAPASANIEEVYIGLDCSSGNKAFTINIADFYSIAGNAPQKSCKIIFQRVDASANTCTIQTTTGTYINGGVINTYVIPATQYKVVTFAPFSTNVWWVVSVS